MASSRVLSTPCRISLRASGGACILGTGARGRQGPCTLNHPASPPSRSSTARTSSTPRSTRSGKPSRTTVLESLLERQARCQGYAGRGQLLARPQVPQPDRPPTRRHDHDRARRAREARGRAVLRSTSCARAVRGLRRCRPVQPGPGSLRGCRRSPGHVHRATALDHGRICVSGEPHVHQYSGREQTRLSALRSRPVRPVHRPYRLSQGVPAMMPAARQRGPRAASPMEPGV